MPTDKDVTYPIVGTNKWIRADHETEETEELLELNQSQLLLLDTMFRGAAWKLWEQVKDRSLEAGTQALNCNPDVLDTDLRANTGSWLYERTLDGIKDQVIGHAENAKKDSDKD